MIVSIVDFLDSILFDQVGAEDNGQDAKDYR